MHDKARYTHAKVPGVRRQRSECAHSTTLCTQQHAHIAIKLLCRDRAVQWLTIPCYALFELLFMDIVHWKKKWPSGFGGVIISTST